MKKWLLLPLLAPLCFSLNAQNWMPLTPNDIYHYRLADSAFITHTLRVDSIRLQGQDSFFYLSPTVDRYAPGGADIWLAGQGTLLGETLIKRAFGRVDIEVKNSLTDTVIYIYPQAGLNETWTAVSGPGITATVSAKTAGTVLGEPDSLKTISFSNGAVWILSKNHGLVRGIDLTNGLPAQLTAIETRNLGSDRLYRFDDFFAFNVGDVYEYRNNYVSIFGPWDEWVKGTILQAYLDPGGVRRYTVRQLRNTNTPINPGATIDTVEWIYYLGELPYTGAHHRQLLGEALLSPSSYARLFDGGLRIGNLPDCGSLQTVVQGAPDILTCTPFLTYYQEYRPHLGRVQFHLSGFPDLTIIEMLTGAVVQGDTVWGSVTPDPEIVPSTEPDRNVAVSVYPNPTTDFLWVKTDTPAKLEEARLYGADGRLVCLPAPSQQGQFDLTALPPGVYALELYWDIGFSTIRVVKQ